MERHFNSRWNTPVSHLVDGKVKLKYEYDQWNSMRKRCKAGGAYQQNKPTYVGCKFEPTWDSFDVFIEWADKQVGFLSKDEEDNYFPLDKDILGGDIKLYSPETCAFVPKRINSFFSRLDGTDNGLPKGVYFKKTISRFIAQGTNWEGENLYLGCYKTPEEAHAAYVVNKEAKAKQLAEFYRDVIDVRVYEKLMSFKA